MSERVMGGVDIHVNEAEGHRHIDFTAGAGVTIGELADALRSAPRDAMITGALVTFFDEDGTEQVEAEDEEHPFPVMTIGTILGTV